MKMFSSRNCLVVLILAISVLFAVNAFAAMGKIAFTSDRDGNNEIYIIKADGTGETRLTNNAASDFYPVLSPDGTKIAFESNRTGVAELYAMNTDGTNVVQLTSGLSDASVTFYKVAWHPNGASLLVTAKNNNQFKLYRMNSDGTGIVLLNDTLPEFYGVRYNRDGSKIYMTRNTPYNGWTSEIYVCDADGVSNMTRLTFDASGGAGGGESRWPDEALVGGISKIVFQRTAGGFSQIHIMNPDGSGITNLSNNSFVEGFASSASDGLLVFQSNRGDGSTNNIWMMNSDGSNPVQLTTSGGL